MRFFASSPLFARYIEIVVCQVIGRFYLWEIRCSYRAFRTNRTHKIIARFEKIWYCPILIFTLSLLSETVIREMAKKITRLEALRIILSNKVVRSQADIQRELARAGFKVSQPTVSSDLQKLHALRQKTPDGYQLILPKTEGYRRPIPIEALPEYLQNTGVVGITFSALWPFSTHVRAMRRGLLPILIAIICLKWQVRWQATTPCLWHKLKVSNASSSLTHSPAWFPHSKLCSYKFWK